MKTKLFFLFAAFALLLSVNAVAQSNGDVNAPAYYYYYGIQEGTVQNPSSPINADNYKTLAESSTTLKDSMTFTSKKGYAYVLVPNTVTEVKWFDRTAGVYSTMKFDVVDTSIPEHLVYRSENPFGIGNVRLDFTYGEVDNNYYYYIGQDPITADNYTTLAETSDTLLKEKEYTIERYGYMYVLCPNSVTSIKVQQPGLGFWSDDSVIIDTSVSIPGHTVFKTTGKCGANASILIEFDYTPVATSIDPVTNTNAERVIYDMRGRKLTDVEKLRSGIYIVNGRKLIVK